MEEGPRKKISDDGQVGSKTEAKVQKLRGKEKKKT